MLDRVSTEIAEAELLRRVARADSAALGELYDAIGGVVYSLALRMLGEPRETEEVVQDVFVQIWNKAATFDGAIGSVLNWSLGITRNRCIDHLRSRQRRSRVFADVTPEAGLERVAAPAAGAAGPDALGESELAAVRQAVESLPADQRQAIAMAFFGGMTHQEIADKLQEPLGTVKARIRRGLLKLKDSLQVYL